MSNNDIYKFRDLVAKAQNPQKVTEADLQFDGSAEQANQLAEEIEQYTDEMDRLLGEIESIVRRGMPSEYRYLENYTFAHFKTLIGGHGYTDRMNTSLRDLIDKLRDHADYMSHDDEDEEV